MIFALQKIDDDQAPKEVTTIKRRLEQLQIG
jgi:hypothetical protein